MSSESEYVIRYEFRFDDDRTSVFVVRLDPQSMANLDSPVDRPRWAALDYCRCPNCPLDPVSSPWCPAAVQLAEPVERFAETLSFTRAEVRATLPERTIYLDTTVQSGLSSLIGLYMATCGCPVLARLRPMVRQHLPFASATETILRSVSSYLLGQYFRQAAGHRPDWELAELATLYAGIAEVNRAFAARLRGAVCTDASLNALVLLDLFAQAMPNSIGHELAELKPLYEAWG